jgi:hypothetical protein
MGPVLVRGCLALWLSQQIDEVIHSPADHHACGKDRKAEGCKLCFCLVLGSYAHLDRRDPNSWWLVISSRYRRLALAMATSFVIGVAAAIGLMIL